MDEADSIMHKPRFVWAFDLGQLIQIASFAITIAGMIWFQAADRAETRRDIAALQIALAGAAPKIDALSGNDSLQNERIGNLSDSMRDIRRMNSEMLTQLGSMREDVAGIKARIMASGR